MGTGFGRFYERKHPDGGWERLDALDDLKVGDTVRLNGSNGLVVSTIKREGALTDFIANRLDPPGPDDDYVVLMHLEGIPGEFPPHKFPLPDQIPLERRKPVPKTTEDADGPLPEKGDDPTPNPPVSVPVPTDSKKSSVDHIREILAGGAERTVDEVIAGFAAAGKTVKADTVKWTLGQMAKTGETERTANGTWKLRNA